MGDDGIFKYAALAALAGVGIYAVSKWLGNRAEVVEVRQDAITERVEIRQESRTDRVTERWEGINEAIENILDARSRKSSGSSSKPAPVTALSGTKPYTPATTTAKNYLKEAVDATKKATPGQPFKTNVPNVYTPVGVRAVPSLFSPAAIVATGILKTR